jgi:hypothetical protein
MTRPVSQPLVPSLRCTICWPTPDSNRSCTRRSDELLAYSLCGGGYSVVFPCVCVIQDCLRFWHCWRDLGDFSLYPLPMSDWDYDLLNRRAEAIFKRYFSINAPPSLQIDTADLNTTMGNSCFIYVSIISRHTASYPMFVFVVFCRVCQKSF